MVMADAFPSSTAGVQSITLSEPAYRGTLGQDGLQLVGGGGPATVRRARSGGWHHLREREDPWIRPTQAEGLSAGRGATASAPSPAVSADLDSVEAARLPIRSDAAGDQGYVGRLARVEEPTRKDELTQWVRRHLDGLILDGNLEINAISSTSTKTLG